MIFCGHVKAPRSGVAIHRQATASFPACHRPRLLKDRTRKMDILSLAPNAAALILFSLASWPLPLLTPGRGSRRIRPSGKTPSLGQDSQSRPPFPKAKRPKYWGHYPTKGQ
jgi:hypothetical protein